MPQHTVVSCTTAKTKKMLQNMRSALLIGLEKCEAADQLEYEESFVPEAGSDRPQVFVNGRADPMLAKFREDNLDAVEGRIAAAETLSSLENFFTVSSDTEKFQKAIIDEELKQFRKQFENYLDEYESRRPVHHLPGMEKMHKEIMGMLKFDGVEETFDIEEYYALEEEPDMSIGENIVGAVASFYKHVGQSEATEKMYKDNPDLEPPALPDLSKDGSTPEEEESLKTFIEHVERPLEDLKSKEKKLKEEIDRLIETNTLPKDYDDYDADSLVKTKRPGKCLEFGQDESMVMLSEEISPLVENLACIQRSIRKMKEDIDERLMLLLLVHRGSRPHVAGNEEALLSEFCRQVERSVNVLMEIQVRKRKHLQDILEWDTTAKNNLSQACAQYNEALSHGSSAPPHRMLPVVSGLCTHLDEELTSVESQLTLIEKQSHYVEAINATLTRQHEADKEKKGFRTSKQDKDKSRHQGKSEEKAEGGRKSEGSRKVETGRTSEGKSEGKAEGNRKCAGKSAGSRKSEGKSEGKAEGGRKSEGKAEGGRKSEDKKSKKGAAGVKGDSGRPEVEATLDGEFGGYASIDPKHCRKELEKVFTTSKMSFRNFQDELYKAKRFSITLSPADGAAVAKWMTLLVQHSLGVSAHEMTAERKLEATEDESWKELERALGHARMDYSDVMKNVLNGKRIASSNGSVIAQSLRVTIARHAMNIVQCKLLDSPSNSSGCVMC